VRNDERNERTERPEPRRVTPPPATVVEMPPRRIPEVHAEPVPEPAPAPAPSAHVHALDSDEIDFSELLEGDRSVIEIDLERDATDVPLEDDGVSMDNGSIRSFNTDNFRTPTFVRKQID